MHFLRYDKRVTSIKSIQVNGLYHWVVLFLVKYSIYSFISKIIKLYFIINITAHRTNESYIRFIIKIDYIKIT